MKKDTLIFIQLSFKLNDFKDKKKIKAIETFLKIFIESKVKKMMDGWYGFEIANNIDIAAYTNLLNLNLHLKDIITDSEKAFTSPFIMPEYEKKARLQYKDL